MEEQKPEQPLFIDFFANASVGISFFVFIVALVYLGVALSSRSAVPVLKKNEGLLEKIQVEVLNGCAEEGIASVTVDSLRKQGFDVIQSGNYYFSDLDKTILIARRGLTPKVKAVASVLGIPEEEIVVYNNKQYYLDASLILGRNYRKLTFLKEI